MPKQKAKYLGEQNYYWCWEEAFAKFGFNDGDGPVQTWKVKLVLTDARYDVTVEEWGCHNTVITSIKRGGHELIPQEGIEFGYDDPRGYLPADIVQLLDEKLPAEGAVFLF